MRYEGDIQRWIPGFKRSQSPFGPAIAIRLAINHLTIELAQRVAADTSTRPDLVVSIPVHPRRRRRRGFNHADPIAKGIADFLDLPWRPDALERTRDTPSQAQLEGLARRKNMRGAFRAAQSLRRTECVWLVDDVLTTGSTLDAAAEALLEAGASEVRALTLAATLPKRRASRQISSYHAAASSDRSERSTPIGPAN